MPFIHLRVAMAFVLVFLAFEGLLELKVLADQKIAQSAEDLIGMLCRDSCVRQGGTSIHMQACWQACMRSSIREMYRRSDFDRELQHQRQMQEIEDWGRRMERMFK